MLENIAMRPPSRGVIFPLSDAGASTTSHGALDHAPFCSLCLWEWLQTTAGCRQINRRAVSLDEFSATASIHLH